MALSASGTIGTFSSGSLGGNPKDIVGRDTVGSGNDMVIVIVFVALSTDTDERCQFSPTEGVVAILLSYCRGGANHHFCKRHDRHTSR